MTAVVAISNLPWWTSDADLETACGALQPPPHISSIQIATDPLSGKSLGRALIHSDAAQQLKPHLQTALADDKSSLTLSVMDKPSPRDIADFLNEPAHPLSPKPSPRQAPPPPVPPNLFPPGMLPPPGMFPPPVPPPPPFMWAPTMPVQNEARRTPSQRASSPSASRSRTPSPRQRRRERDRDRDRVIRPRRDVRRSESPLRELDIPQEVKDRLKERREKEDVRRRMRAGYRSGSESPRREYRRRSRSGSPDWEERRKRRRDDDWEEEDRRRRGRRGRRKSYGSGSSAGVKRSRSAR